MKVYGLAATLFVLALVQAASGNEPNHKVKCERNPSPLFQSDELLKLTFKGQFPVEGIYSSSRLPITPAVITSSGSDSLQRELNVKVQARGKTRLVECPFKPLRVIWNEGEDRSGTPFDKLKGKDIKLVTHCYYTSGKARDQWEANELVLKEYYLYKLLKALGLPTLDARLAKIQYAKVDGTEIVQGFGYFLEPNSALASRCGLKHLKDDEWPTMLESLNPRIVQPFLMSRLIIDAADYVLDDISQGVYGHNAEAFRNESETVLMVPYDFNDSSLVASRGYALGFLGPLKTWFSLFRKGPFTNQGVLWPMSYSQREDWTNDLMTLSSNVLSNRSKAFQLIESMAVSEASKRQFRTRLEKAFVEIEKLLAVEEPEAIDL